VQAEGDNGLENLISSISLPKENRPIYQWLDIKFFARLSEPIVNLIYWPFVTLALIIVARSTFFDNWDTPGALVIVFVMSFGLAVYCAISLRLTAEKIRRENLKRLNDLLMAAKGDRELSATADQLELLIRRVESIRDGAFASFSQQPVVRGFIIPLAAMGVYIIEYFKSM